MIRKTIENALDQYGQAKSWGSKLNAKEELLKNIRDLFLDHRIVEIAEEGIPQLPTEVYDRLPAYIKENLYFVRDISRSQEKLKKSFYSILSRKIRGAASLFNKKEAEKKYNSGTCSIGSIAVMKKSNK